MQAGVPRQTKQVLQPCSTPSPEPKMSVLTTSFSGQLRREKHSSHSLHFPLFFVTLKLSGFVLMQSPESLISTASSGQDWTQIVQGFRNAIILKENSLEDK